MVKQKNNHLFLYLLSAIGILFFIFIFLAPTLYVFVAQPLAVNGMSMSPSYSPGEYYMANKFEYTMGEPKRGDVAVFHAPESSGCPKGTSCDFISRIIGLPGESISLQNGIIMINSKPVDETSYVEAGVQTNGGALLKDGQTFTIPSDQYFVMGDNRPYSSDSRSWGTVSKDDIFGKMWFCYANCQ